MNASKSASKSTEAARGAFRPLIQALLMIALGFMVAFPFMRGHGFYRLALDARFEHADYRVLSPGGFIGHGYGILGTGLILTNLLYLARRRLAWLPVGSLRAWLDLHVVTGVGGSILILFHSAFQLRSQIASVTSVSLATVVATGLVGRYIYALTPQTGDLTLEERLRELEATLPSFVASVRTAVARCKTTTLPVNASPLRVLLTFPRWMLEARRRRRAIRITAKADPTLKGLRKTQRSDVRTLVKDLSRRSAGEIDRIAGGSLLRLWRSLHRFMAILMVLSVTVHIGVAWFYGYRWIFSHG
jgi:hypothetical protein